MEPASPNSVAQIEDDAKKTSMMGRARMEQQPSVKQAKPAPIRSKAFSIRPCAAKMPKRKIVLARPVNELDDECDDEEDFETDVHLIDDISKLEVKNIAKKCRNLVKKSKNLNTSLHSMERLKLILEDIEAIKEGEFVLLDSDDDCNADALNEDIIKVPSPMKISSNCDIQQPGTCV